uniref:Protein PML n=1 Tax=Varanus komodoensis TaxID=61221 RepID=A0A8D2J1Q6_VARKO
MEEEFQFLLCQRCRKEAKNPKLLFCLHNLCTECLEESKPIGQCPICLISIRRVGGEALLDNMLFASLQEKLSTYQKITTNRDLACNRCKEGAEFWCNECNEFLCSRCHDAHQWYLKQKNHESQKLLDLKNNTAQGFLEEARKSCILFCSEPSHNNQVISIYCRGCRKPLCCSCALLDGEHYNAKLYCDIRAEIESRKEDLQRISRELEEKRQAHDGAHNCIHNHMQHLQKLRQETQTLIQEKVEEMVQWLRQKGDELLEKVDHQLHQECEDVKKKLKVSEHFVSRMESGKQLVEKMNLFASDQEVLDMHPFIRESLDELRREKLPVVNVQGQMEDFAEVRSELHSLFQRVKGERGEKEGELSSIRLFLQRMASGFSLSSKICWSSCFSCPRAKLLSEVLSGEAESQRGG